LSFAFLSRQTIPFSLASIAVALSKNPVDDALCRPSVYFFLMDQACRVRKAGATGCEARIALPDPVYVPFWDLDVRDCAKREVNSIDAPPKPKVDVQESIANAKAYCKQNPESFVSLRDYSGGIYNETCAAFAAEQHATDPTYKIGSD
jgi:hypothetical protein